MFADQLGTERLADKRRARRQVAGLRADYAGGDHDGDMRLVGSGLPGQRKTITLPAWHLDVGKQHMHRGMVLLEHADGVIAVMRLQSRIASLLKDIGGIHADHGIVIGDDGKGVGLWCLAGHGLA